MASEVVGNISVIASINTAGYDAGKSKIEKGNQDLEKSAKSTSSNFSGAWTGAIAGVVASITSKLMNAIGNLTGDMTDLYDSSKKFPKVLEVMGATGDFASQSFADMKDYADKTIYSLGDMTSTFSSLYGIVGSNSGTLVKALGGVSSLATDAGQAMKSWSMQLTQMVSKPKVAWVDFRILLEQNPAAIAKIAQAMGKTMPEIVTAVNNGELATSDFLTALQKVGSDPSLQAAATNSDTFGNSLGQLTASVASAGAKVLEQLGPSLVGIINGASKAFDGLGTSVSGVITFISDNKDIFSTLAVAVGTATVAFVLYNATMKVVAATQAAVAAVSTYLTLVNSLQAQGLGVLKASWLALNIVMKASPIGIVITLIAALVAGLIWFFTQTETGKKMWEGFMKVMGGVWNAITGFFTGAWNTITGVWNGAGAFFGGIWNGIKNAFGAVGKWFSDVFKGAWEGVRNVFNAGGNVFNGIKDGISTVFKSVVNGLISGINAVIAVPFNAINTALKAVKNVNIFGAKPFDFINTISVPQIPKLANGGIATSPMLAMIGEGRESEAVIPLSKLDEMINGDNGPRIENHIGTINIASDVDADRFLRRLTNDQEIVSSGLVPQQKYMGAL